MCSRTYSAIATDPSDQTPNFEVLGTNIGHGAASMKDSDDHELSGLRALHSIMQSFGLA